MTGRPLTVENEARAIHSGPSTPRVVGFLAADASSYITGQVWGINGGMDM